MKIAYGTDIGEGDHAMEFALLIANGMAPIDAIRAATSSAAALIGDEADIGSVQSGRYADLVALDGDPLTDTTAFERAGFVMKGGMVVKQDGKAVVP